MLDRHFSAEQIAPIAAGIHKYIRLIGLISDPNPLELKWLSDEWDLHTQLETLSRAVKATEPMIGKRKYQGIDFEVTTEVKKDMQTYLMSGRTDAESALFKKRNMPMYYLVIIPVLNLFKGMDHQKTIDIIDEVVKDVQNMIWSTESYGTHDDALVARMQVQQLIKQSEEQRLAELNARKRPKRKSKKELIIELFEEVATEELELLYD